MKLNMRSKQEVLAEFYSLTGGETGVRTNQELREYVVMETLLNIRDLLQQKQKRKILSTEVTLTQAEQTLLDKLDEHGE